jgi:hypothetical protein
MSNKDRNHSGPGNLFGTTLQRCDLNSGFTAIEISMGLAISLAVYWDRRTLAQNHLILGQLYFENLWFFESVFYSRCEQGILGNHSE